MENLGWITNCQREGRCPQNWLERSVAEIPTEVDCHVCGQMVTLLPDAESFEEAQHRALAAWPVVPPIAVGVPPARLEPLKSQEMRERQAPARPEPEPPYEPEPVAPPVAAQARGWQVVLSSGEKIRVDKAMMVVGRSRNCDVIIPSAKVSRQHATLALVGDELYIEDLGSANGLWRDGLRISRERIRPGDVVTISDETLRFELA